MNSYLPALPSKPSGVVQLTSKVTLSSEFSTVASTVVGNSVVTSAPSTTVIDLIALTGSTVTFSTVSSLVTSSTAAANSPLAATKESTVNSSAVNAAFAASIASVNSSNFNASASVIASVKAVFASSNNTSSPFSAYITKSSDFSYPIM